MADKRGGRRISAGRHKVSEWRRAARLGRIPRKSNSKPLDRAPLDRDELLVWRLLDLPLAEAVTSDEEWQIDPRVLRAAWRDHAAEMLALWIPVCPGKRPSCWWKFDAPRAPRGTRQ